MLVVGQALPEGPGGPQALPAIGLRGRASHPEGPGQQTDIKKILCLCNRHADDGIQSHQIKKYFGAKRGVGVPNIRVGYCLGPKGSGTAQGEKTRGGRAPRARKEIVSTQQR
jgi:hypothetical protein